ncbi:MAG TPA: DegV family protein [Rectinemataceae bacterium]|nr:DegV family protein [Rectinemataceae bacterium]
MKIAYLDGPRLRTAFLAGSQSILSNAEGLNAINVFPVPDGDTGTNMASTMRSIAASLRSALHRDAGSVLKQAARSALEGARGNSGAILAQFLQSLAHELGSEARIGAKRLAQGAVVAAEKTKAALTVPREGTILTVLHDWAGALRDSATHCDDIFLVFHSGLDAAKASLERTRNFLPEMRRAGVVDAGAKGFVHLLDGMAELLKPGKWLRARLALGGDKRVRAVSEGFSVEPTAETAVAMNSLDLDAADPDSPRYCTEALLLASSMPLPTIREALSGLGDSIVVAGDEEIARVHVHSDRPSAVFDLLEATGAVEQHKVDDMELQRRLALRSAGKAKRPCVVIVDTGCDLPGDYMLDHGIIKVPALITINGATRPDGAALELEAIHSKMRNDPGFSMSTSQPVESSFVRAFTLALSQADEALYIGLSSAMSGTFLAGKKAAEAFGGRIGCFDSKTITAGTGALTALAVERAEAGSTAGEILAELEKKRGELALFVAVKDLASLIRSGRLHGIKSLVLRKFGLKPLLATDRTGKAVTKGLYIGEKNTVSALFSRIRGSISSDVAWTIHIVHVAAKEEAEKLASLCGARASSGTEILVSDMGPLLASIGWLGAVGIAAVPRS